jgi:hypothetical protein
VSILALSSWSCTTNSIATKHATVPASYLVKCGVPKLLADHSISGLIEAVRENAEQYHECRIIHNSLVDLLERRNANDP